MLEGFENEIGRCWSQNQCQQIPKDSCHNECIGCKGPTNQDCNICRTYADETKCVAKCKKPKVLYAEYGTCITTNECFKMPNGPWWPFKEECVASCPTGYEEISQQGKGCKLCENCPKYCNGIEVDSIASAEMLQGCTHLNGSLSIRVDSKGTVDVLEKNLGLVREITGYLRVYRSYSLTSLEFLKNLKVIQGEELHNHRYALIVYENQNLHKLWNWDDFSLKIDNGTFLFHYNSHLCLQEIEKLAAITNITYSPFDVSPYSNGDKRACSNITLNVTLTNLTSTSVTLEWNEFTNNGNNSVIIGYLVYYIEDNLLNITVFDERDECDKNNWNSNFVSNSTVTLEKLNAYAYYAYYIKIYVTVPSLGGQTEIMYFKTLSDDPTNPYNLKAYSLSYDSITLTWSPPEFPNGLLSHYVLIAYLKTDDPRFLSRRNYCDYPHRTQRLEVMTTSSPNKWSKIQDTCCKKNIKAHTTNFNSICNVLNLGGPQKGCQNYMSYSLEDVLDSDSRDVGIVLINSSNRIISKRDALTNMVEEIIDYPDATSYTITSLKHFSMYFILLKACNNKTQCSGPEMVPQRTLMKEDADVIASEISVEVEGQNVILQWAEPKVPNAITVAYYIEHKRLDLENAAPFIECITQEEYAQFSYKYKIKNLLSGEYSVRVKPVSLAGQGKFSEVKEFQISSSSNVTLTASLISLVFIVLTAGVIGYCYYYYKRNGNVDKLRLLANVNYTRNDYIPDEWELKRENIEIQTELGQGSFGMVYSGIIKTTSRPCAIKTINSDADESDRMYFLNEASVMKTFSNAYHVVKLLGVVSKGSPPLVVMELMSRGDLKTFLRQSRNPSSAITSAEMYRMSAEIADGMMYLSAKKFVHRDLAARNCMMAADHTVKIGDFGMARDIYYSDYYKKDTGGLMPIRWMSPESLADGIFTTESDVWSYGIVLWEIVTLAEQPYQGLANEQVLQFVTAQGTLERPLQCSDLLYDIMEFCWKWKPKDRPRFQDIIQKLEPHIGQYFRIVSFYHSSEGEQYIMNPQEKISTPSSLLSHLNKNDGVYWDTSYDDVDLNIH
ncbi:hypothetical protein FQA39_LY00051 [Lamprigera yunnana]|nr:hypothetical protein FQA39_LY00051 [Lamprigera yunnana]